MGPSRQHDDGGVIGPAVPPQVLEDGVTVFSGKHEVEQNQVRNLFQGHLQAEETVVGYHGLGSGPVQIERDEIGDVGLVLDNQDSLHVTGRP